MTENKPTYTIWIEAEEWCTGWDPIDSNTDVIVHLDDGSRWMATFVSYKNVATLTQKDKQTGESLSGAYFWVSDMILIDETSRKRIEEVIEHLMEEDYFYMIFTKAETMLEE